MNYILPFAAAVALANILFFFALPMPLSCSLADLSPQSIFFFQFSHFDFLHLVENLMGLFFTAALALELDMRPDDFILAYFVGVFIALPMLFLFPGAAIAGNSTGIFGALAATLLMARRLVSIRVTYPLALLFIFSISITSALSGSVSLAILKTDLFHLAGFLAGAAITISMSGTQSISGVCK